MRTLGLIGGTSWVSTMDYYKFLNRGINRELGDLNSGKILLYSVNFQELRRLFDVNDWEKVSVEIIRIAQLLEKAGAEGIILCSNTTHVVANELALKINIPVLHIAEAVTQKITEAGLKKVALIGTQFTMEHGYFQAKLLEAGIETLIPDKKDRQYLNENIFGELTREIFTPHTRNKYLRIIEEMINSGAEGVIYGCTEIPILLEGHSPPIPCFDTLKIHSDYGIRFALSKTTALI